MENILSMTHYWGQIVDCRVLHLELEFYCLTQAELRSIGEFLFRKTEELLGDGFYLCWDCNDRPRKQEKMPSQIQACQKELSFTFEGNVLSDIVYDAKSYKAYNRLTCCPPYGTLFSPDAASRVSVDYPEVFFQYFAANPEKTQYKELLLKIINEPDRKHLAYWTGNDTEGLFFSHPHKKIPELYYGTYQFMIAYTCLGNLGIPVSEKLMQIAKSAAMLYQNVSGRVALTPIWGDMCSTHMLHFYGAPKEMPVSHIACDPYEARSFAYAKGAEWFNLLSPLQLSHCPEISASDQIIDETLPGGGRAFQLKKSIAEADVSDLAEMKRSIYGALWPGWMSYPFEYLFPADKSGLFYGVRPRSAWGRTPIFPEEITVAEDRVIFQHCSAPRS